MNELVEPARAADRFELFVGDALHVVHKILPHRSLKEPGVLQNHAEETVYILPAHIGDGYAVDRYAAAVDLKEPHEKIDHCGLARAGRADDGDLLSGEHLGGKVLDDDLLRVTRIAEPDVVKADPAAHIGELRGLFALVGHLLAFEKIEDAVRGGGGGLHVRHALRHLRQRRGEKPDIQNERDDHAELDRAVHREDRAENAHRDIGDVADNVHKRLHHAGEKLRSPVRVVNGGVERIELRADLPPGAAEPHDFMPGVHFLHIPVQRAETFLPRGEIPLRSGQDQHRQQHAEDRHADGNEREPPLGDEHHKETADKLRGRADDRGQAVRESLLQGGNVVCDAAENVALRGRAEILLRHAVDLGGKLAAHAVGHFQRDDRHRVVLDKAENCTEYIDDSKENADFGDRREIDVSGEAVRHQRGDPADLVRPEDRHHRAERGEDQRQDDDAHA